MEIKKNEEDMNSDTKEQFQNPKCCWYFDSSFYRVIAAVVITIKCFATAFASDVPGSLQSEIQQDFHQNTAHFEYLYSFGEVPSVVISIVGGILIDRYLGVLKASLIFACLSLIGQLIIITGGYLNTYWMMLSGRFIYGCGNGIIEVTACVFVVLWFEGKEISLMFGIGQSVSRLGTSGVFLMSSILQSYVSDHLPEKFRLGTCLLPGLVCILVVLTCLCLLGYIGKINGKDMGRKVNQKEDKITFRKSLSFSVPMCMIAAVIAAILTNVIIFNSMAQHLMSYKFNMKKSQANKLASMFNVLAAVTSPIPGILIDKIGREISFNMLGHLLGIASQIILATTNWNPYVFLVLFATSYSTLNSCTWPLVSRVVEPYQVGTAYGIILSLIYLSASVFSIFAGYLVDTYGNQAVIYFFIAVYSVGTSCVVILWLWDKFKGNGTLNMSINQRIQFEKQYTDRIMVTVEKFA